PRDDRDPRVAGLDRPRAPCAEFLLARLTGLARSAKPLDHRTELAGLPVVNVGDLERIRADARVADGPAERPATPGQSHRPSEGTVSVLHAGRHFPSL